MREAAGIVPYIKKPNGDLYFLLGKELARDNLLCGFVGGREYGDLTLQDTAVREFNEETCTVFSKELDFIRNKVLYDTYNTKYFRTSTQNSVVTIWFIRFSDNHDMRRDEREFILNLAQPFPPQFKEKSRIEWVQVNDIDRRLLSWSIRRDFWRIMRMFSIKKKNRFNCFKTKNLF